MFALNWSGCSSVSNTAVISVFPAAALASPPLDTQLISTSQHQKLPCLSVPRILSLQKLMPPPTEVVWKDCQPLQIRAYSSLWLDLLNSGYKFDLCILDRTNSWNSHSVKKKLCLLHFSFIPRRQKFHRIKNGQIILRNKSH